MRRSLVRVVVLLVAAAVALLAWMTCAGPQRAGDEGEPGGGTRAGTRVPGDEGRDGTVPERAPRPRAARPGEEVALPTESVAQGDAAAPVVVEPHNAGELPRDALGTGEHEFTLVIADDVTGAPVLSGVRLWRLGVPASDAWTAGDHVQQTEAVPVTGFTFRNLPAGRYRVEPSAARTGSDDPPEFEVPGPSPSAPLTLRIPMPRAFPVRCVVFDEWGQPVVTAMHVSGGQGSSWSSFRAAPSWATPRRARNPDTTSAGFGGGGGGRSGGRRMRTVTAGTDGFDLGAMKESLRVRSSSRRDTLRFDGRNEVVAEVRSDDMGAPGGTTYVGLTVPLARLVSHVTFPDGRPVLDGGAKVAAECRASAKAEPTSTGARSLEIVVDVTHDDHRPLKFTWSHVGEPFPPVRLVPITGTPVETPK